MIGSHGPASGRERIVTAGTALMMASACGSDVGNGGDKFLPVDFTNTDMALAAAKTAQVTIQTTPELFPAFDAAVSDYVVRCTGDPVQFHASVTGPRNVWVTVDGQSSRSASSSTSVTVSSGQSFQFVVTGPRRVSTTYHVRCLPLDFPAFAVERPGIPQAAGYIATPNIRTDFGPPPPGTSTQYASLFDNRGVPLWWIKSANGSPIDAKLLPNGHIIWLQQSTGLAEEHRLDGTLVRTVSAVGGPTDIHDVQLLPNGNYLMGRSFLRTNVDLTGCGGSSSGMLLDNDIQEVTPDGSLVWVWDALDHIPVSEGAFNCAGDIPQDVYHFNSIEADGDGVVLSFRHLHAVYKVARSNGAIMWKLGGSTRDESLTVVDDPLVPSGGLVFGGQHDARILPDGTLTVHDNRLLQSAPAPRAVRFRIDPIAKTATFIESVSEPDVTGALCCGSARKLPTGNWVTEWGSNPMVTELAPDGTRLFRLTFTQGLFSYRADPVLALDRPALRSGMDAQFPRVVTP
jgi:hypothetical protein